MIALTVPATTLAMVVGAVPVGLAVARLARRAASIDARRQASGPGPGPATQAEAGAENSGSTVKESDAEAASSETESESGAGGDAGPVAGPWVEVGSVVALGLVAARFGLSWEAAPYLGVVVAIVATSLTDLHQHRIPDWIMAPAAAGCGLAMTVAALGLGQPERLTWAAWGAGLYAGVLLAIRLVRPKGMGLGDVKLAGLLGGAIGWLQPSVLTTLELVTWSLMGASVLTLTFALARGRLDRGPDPSSFWEQQIPFGPALSASALGVVVFGELLVG
jgi:leader peptidase (prepilin peptidase)/N-methyltransferase